MAKRRRVLVLNFAGKQASGRSESVYLNQNLSGNGLHSVKFSPFLDGVETSSSTESNP